MHKLHGLVIRGHLKLEHFAAGLDPLQRIAAFVGQARDHLPDAGQALGAEQLFLCVAPFGEILADRQHRGAAVKVVEPLGIPHEPA